MLNVAFIFAFLVGLFLFFKTFPHFKISNSNLNDYKNLLKYSSTSMLVDFYNIYDVDR